jgi:hypothetical protein
MMTGKLPIFTLVTLFVLSVTIPQAFAFDVSTVNVTLADAQVDEYENYDIITAIFSIFNGDTQPAQFIGPNMLYLNDTNSDWWEYSNHNDLEGYSETDCPILDEVINPGNTTNVKLCYLVQHDAAIGYSVIANNHVGLMDMDTKEFKLEYVPDWFKTNANSWCNGQISDSDYINSIQFNIQQGIFSVLRGQSVVDSGTVMPDWVKNNACAWSNDVINQYEFLDGVYWLIDNGKIQLD